MQVGGRRGVLRHHFKLGFGEDWDRDLSSGDNRSVDSRFAVDWNVDASLRTPQLSPRSSVSDCEAAAFEAEVRAYKEVCEASRRAAAKAEMPTASSRGCKLVDESAAIGESVEVLKLDIQGHCHPVELLAGC